MGTRTCLRRPRGTAWPARTDLIAELEFVT
jgi:hypothetical protein